MNFRDIFVDWKILKNTLATKNGLNLEPVVDK